MPRIRVGGSAASTLAEGLREARSTVDLDAEARRREVAFQQQMSALRLQEQDRMQSMALRGNEDARAGRRLDLAEQAQGLQAQRFESQDARADEAHALDMEIAARQLDLANREDDRVQTEQRATEAWLLGMEGIGPEQAAILSRLPERSRNVALELFGKENALRQVDQAWGQIGRSVGRSLRREVPMFESPEVAEQYVADLRERHGGDYRKAMDEWHARREAFDFEERQLQAQQHAIMEMAELRKEFPVEGPDPELGTPGHPNYDLIREIEDRIMQTEPAPYRGLDEHNRAAPYSNYAGILRMLRDPKTANAYWALRSMMHGAESALMGHSLTPLRAELAASPVAGSGHMPTRAELRARGQVGAEAPEGGGAGSAVQPESAPSQESPGDVQGTAAPDAMTSTGEGPKTESEKTTVVRMLEAAGIDMSVPMDRNHPQAQEIAAIVKTYRDRKAASEESQRKERRDALREINRKYPSRNY